MGQVGGLDFARKSWWYYSHLNRMHTGWVIKDKRVFLLAIMEELAGNARISFEGDLSGLGLLSIEGASQEETRALRRNTLWPRQDFIVVPLEPSATKKILSAIGGTLPRKIIHIQIEKAGILEFATYDNFHPECIVFGHSVNHDFLEALISRRVLYRI